MKKNYEIQNYKNLWKQNAKFASYQGVTYRDDGDDPISPPVDLTAEFGDDKDEEIKIALESRVEEAKEKGLR